MPGAARDAVQRAIVYHHVADMLGPRAWLCLARARRRRWRSTRRWRGSSATRAARAGGLERAERAALAERVAEFGDGAARDRCRALRRAADGLSAGRDCRGSGDAAALRLDPALVAALRAVHGARGRSSAASGAPCSRRIAIGPRRFGERVDAGACARSTGRWRGDVAPARLLRLTISAARFCAGRAARGWARIERQLRRVEAAAAELCRQSGAGLFQAAAADRRARAAATDGDHLSPDEAVRLAA